jgi:hypothetical protein
VVVAGDGVQLLGVLLAQVVDPQRTGGDLRERQLVGQGVPLHTADLLRARHHGELEACERASGQVAGDRETPSGSAAVVTASSTCLTSGVSMAMSAAGCIA